jgi:four helix bundle protein
VFDPWNFAAHCGKAVDALPETRMGRHIAGLPIRCGTSAAPNYAEACAAKSRNDLVHKLGIALKELRESRVWLRMCAKCELVTASVLVPLTDECTQTCRLTQAQLRRRLPLDHPDRRRSTGPGCLSVPMVKAR